MEPLFHFRRGAKHAVEQGLAGDLGCGKVLGHVVVEVPGDAGPLGLLGLEERARQFSHVLLGLLELGDVGIGADEARHPPRGVAHGLAAHEDPAHAAVAREHALLAHVFLRVPGGPGGEFAPDPFAVLGMDMRKPGVEPRRHAGVGVVAEQGQELGIDVVRAAVLPQFPHADPGRAGGHGVAAVGLVEGRQHGVYCLGQVGDLVVAGDESAPLPGRVRAQFADLPAQARHARQDALLQKVEHGQAESQTGDQQKHDVVALGDALLGEDAALHGHGKQHGGPAGPIAQQGEALHASIPLGHEQRASGTAQGGGDVRKARRDAWGLEIDHAEVEHDQFRQPCDGGRIEPPSHEKRAARRPLAHARQNRADGQQPEVLAGNEDAGRRAVLFPCDQPPRGGRLVCERPGDRNQVVGRRLAHAPEHEAAAGVVEKQQVRPDGFEALGIDVEAQKLRVALLDETIRVVPHAPVGDGRFEALHLAREGPGRPRHLLLHFLPLQGAEAGLQVAAGNGVEHGEKRRESEADDAHGGATQAHGSLCPPAVGL
ncbi:hypothetical protein DSECCO2_638880 [anaerobic digester metagenome]